MSKSLIKLQIGPVQDFIAQARSTRDLWSGSYLLSWLMAAGVVKLVQVLKAEHRLSPAEAEGAVISPNLDAQPLYQFRRDGSDSPADRRAVLTPNIPNLLVAVLPVDEQTAQGLAKAMKDAIEGEWHNLATVVWNRMEKAGLVTQGQAERFRRQRDRLLSITWQVTPYEGDYSLINRLNGWQHDAVRQTREFHAWAQGRWEAGDDYRKDFLTGREEAVCGGHSWWKDRVAPLGGFWLAAFRERQASDLYGAITLIKRLWYRTYLTDAPWHLDVRKNFPLPSTRQLATGTPDAEEDDEEATAKEDERYFAILAMDGDDMGRWLRSAKTEAEHRKFSSALSQFAFGHADQIVRHHQGRLIYAGGDDVLAMFPAQTAIECASSLRAGFRRIVNPDIEVSAGIAVAHFKAPLQDVIRAARAAEHRAKGVPGKAALAVSLLKRSGEITEWTCRWADEGLELYAGLAQALAAKEVSARFPHRLTELLTPYRTDVIVAGRRKVADAKEFDSLEVIRAELPEILNRQRGPNWNAAAAADLAKLVGNHADRLTQRADADAVNAPLRAFTGLAQTVAFTHRNRRSNT
jgi:CRISPR-associated protein Cmr2